MILKNIKVCVIWGSDRGFVEDSGLCVCVCVCVCVRACARERERERGGVVMSWETIVDIVTFMGGMVWGSIPSGGKIFCIHPDWP